MTHFRQLALSIHWLGASLIVGLMIPTVFEFTQQPAARSRHSGAQQIALWVLVVTFGAVVTLQWLDRCGPPAGPRSTPHPLRFRVRDMLLITLLTALLLTLARALEVPAATILMTIAIVLASVWTWRRGRGAWLRLIGHLACLYGPFCWMVAFNRPFGRTSGLLPYVAIGPGVLPAEMLRAVLGGVDGDHLTILAAMFALLLLFVGVWAAGRGGRLAAALATLSLVVSTITSFIVHAMYRM